LTDRDYAPKIARWGPDEGHYEELRKKQAPEKMPLNSSDSDPMF